MANGGVPADDFVVLSQVRPGLKREFAFALKAQTEISRSLGRTRSKKAPEGVHGDGVAANSVTKRRKTSGARRGQKGNESLDKSVEKVDVLSEEEAKSDVVDVEDIKIDEGVKDDDVVVPVICCDNDGRVDIKEDVGDNGWGKELVGAMCEDVTKGSEIPADEGVCNASLRRTTRSAVKRPVPANEKEERDDKTTGETSHCRSPVVTTTPISKKGPIKKGPKKLKELLETGLLEGLPVMYIRGSKAARTAGPSGLKGVIRGCGILCFCDACEGNQVVSPTVFELHAGSANKRPPEYIYLKNGITTLRDIMNVWKDTNIEMLEEALKEVTGLPALKESAFCLNCRGPLPDAGIGKSVILCLSCSGVRELEPEFKATHAAVDNVKSAVKPAPPPKSPESVAAMLSFPSKNPEILSKGGSSGSKSQGKLTRKDLRLHKLVFKEEILPDGTEVAYYARGERLLVGYKKGSGILCTCCNREISASQFEAHAGWPSRRKPYLHIYTSNGVSLHELALSLSKGRMATSENDDLCSICADGGDLVCCDGCPRAFHAECVSLLGTPEGDWYCRYCQTMFQKEKFVEHNANAIAAGRVAGVDPIEQITNRCIRIVESPEAGLDRCALCSDVCRKHEFSNSGFGPRTVIYCDQCEREYHVGCLKDHGIADLQEIPEGDWFCCEECKVVHLAMEKAVTIGEEPVPDECLSAIKRKHENITDLDIKWRLLRGKKASPEEKKSLLARAVSIFHDRFGHISDDGRPGGDFIPAIVYGKHVQNQDFRGMHCAVLTVNQKVVAVVTLRLFGQDVAELPLVATDVDFQGKGYFQCLFSCTEMFLRSMKVRNFVLPAAEEAESLWINRFGFRRMTGDEIVQTRFYNILFFQGTSLLTKPLV